MSKGLSYRSALIVLGMLLAYSFAYIPMILMVIFSFNNDQIAYSWSGFSMQWYSALFNNNEIWDSLFNSLLVSSSAVILALTMSTLFVFYSSSYYVRRFVPLFYANVAVPEIVLAVSLLTMFAVCLIPLGLGTLIVAHTLIGFGYVMPIVYNRYNEIDIRIIEAAYDLGATRYQVLKLIVVPLLKPALISAGLLMFVISFDDFLLSFFCSGTAVQTLPIYIYSLIRAGTSPIVNALSTLLLMMSTVVMTLFFITQVRMRE